MPHIRSSAPESAEMAVVVLIAMLLGLVITAAILLYLEKKHIE